MWRLLRPLYNLATKIRRPCDRIVSVTLVRKVSSTQKSTKETPEKGTVKGIIKNHETHHHGFAFVADEYCWVE